MLFVQVQSFTTHWQLAEHRGDRVWPICSEKRNHVRSLCYRSEGFHTDVGSNWSIGDCRSRCNDSWIRYGHALGSLHHVRLLKLATFFATIAFCASTVIYHTLLKSITNDADKWWRASGGVFLLAYGLYNIDQSLSQ